MFANDRAECNPEAARAQLEELGRYVAGAARDGAAAHAVERHLFRQVLALGAKLFGWFLRLVGPGDLGEAVALEGGRVVKRLPGEPGRRLVTVFGGFRIPRCVYGTRPGQKIELAPTDQRLQLPEGDVSYLLQEWGQMLGVEHAFAAVDRTLEAILGLGQSVDTLERGSRKMAEAAGAFRAAQPAPDPAKEGAILVASEDNTGVPMVRPARGADRPPAGAHRKRGEKANKKQMACIGCVYTVEPHVRTAGELIAALFRDPPEPGAPDGGPADPPEAPQARQKRYWAELTRQAREAAGELGGAGQVVRAQDEVFRHMARDIMLRRKPGQVLVHLSDGQRSLEADRLKYLPKDDKAVDILDLMHVLPRLWEAAHLFHPEGSDQAAAFVRERLPYVLNGCTADLVADLRRMGAAHGLGGAGAGRLRRACGFLEANLHRMEYDEYLKAGYPIATGVIEGACRHVVKDRMERTGMRWKVPGANAMLQLRAVSANGDWNTFQAFRTEQERSRLYPHRDATERIPWPIAA